MGTAIYCPRCEARCLAAEEGKRHCEHCGNELPAYLLPDSVGPAAAGSAASGADGAPAKPVKPPIPGWAWVFAVACGIIPILTLGGALPAVIGIGGASGCIGVARNPELPVGTRIGICVGITALCWIAVIALIGTFAAMQGAR